MNKGDLKNLAIRARHDLLKTAVSCGMNEMQAKETAYFSFMKSVIQCYLDENEILMLAEQFFPDWHTPVCLHSVQTELISLLKKEIPHEIWISQVQIIGWMHQYYQTEYKDAIFLKKKRTSRISEQDIAVTTQFFTPEWLGKYLVHNSLGRFWNETHTKQKLSGLRYFIPERIQSGQTEKIRIQKLYQEIPPEKIRFLDPCMGTGHILLEAFDIFMQIYQDSGYDTKTAVKYILKKNLWGLELEQHTCEIAEFMLLMKAASYDPSYLSCPVKLNTAFFQDSSDPGTDKICGSLLHRIEIPEIDGILMQNYHIVVTNPPYMGNSGMPELLSAFVKQNYPDSKQDLYACFIERCYQFTKLDGFFAMLTMHGWMFLSSFTKLREKLFQNATMINLLHLGAYGFDLADVGTIVQTAGFVMQKSSVPEYNGNYINLCEIHDSEQKHQAFLEQKAKIYSVSQECFSQIPNAPMIYWASEQVFQLFHEKKLGNFAETKQGITTSDNQKFVRKWYEVNYASICFKARNAEQAAQSQLKWFPYQKGGGYRKWYGNHIYIINYQHNGRELLAFHEKLNLHHVGGRLKNKEYYFKKSITWTFIATTSGFRIGEEGFLFDVAGSSLFTETDYQRYAILGFLCSSTAEYLLYLLNPTMNIQTRDVKALPYIEISQKSDADRVQELVQENIQLCKEDWDSFETSWNFKKHPLL